MDACPPLHPTEAAAIQEMIRTQLRGRDIHAPAVLAALAAVPRSVFVGDANLRRAYDDAALPIDLGQTISQPYIVAKMTELLDLQGDERVLEVGTGSGYQAAVLSKLVRKVFTVEWFAELSAAARRRHAALGLTNIEYRVGDGSAGWPEEAPFDGILVTAARSELPKALQGQLALGGRMVAPVGRPSDQHLMLYRRTNSGLEQRRILACRFVPLLGEGRDADD